MNSRPLDYETDALPTAPKPLGLAKLCGTLSSGNAERLEKVKNQPSVLKWEAV